MKARTFLFVVACLAAPTARAEPRQLLLLASPVVSDLDENALIEATSIYTRDLGYQLSRGARAPEDLTTAAMEEVVALVRARHARLAFWFRRRSQEHDVVLYGVSMEDTGPEVHALRVRGVAGPELYRALALKVRAVLTGAAKLEPNEPTPPLASPSAASSVAVAPSAPEIPIPPPPAPTAVLARPALAQAVAPTTDAPAPAPTRSRSQLLIAVGYRLTLPLQRDLIRHGVAIEAARPLGKRIELSLGVDVMTRAERETVAGTASLFDLPVRLGVRLLLRWNRLALGLGPQLSLHVLSVSSIGFDRARGDYLGVVAGLGGELSGRVRVSDHLSFDLRFLIEAIVPATQFLLHESPSVETGSVLLGLSAGMLFAVP